MMLEIKTLSEEISVSGQVSIADISTIAARGFRSLVNNRPDNEEPGQPRAAEIAAAAHAHGLVYRDLPIVSGAISLENVRSFHDTVLAIPKPVLAFCRSGSRSAMTWMLSQPR